MSIRRAATCELVGKIETAVHDDRRLTLVESANFQIIGVRTNPRNPQILNTVCEMNPKIVDRITQVEFLEHNISTPLLLEIKLDLPITRLKPKTVSTLASYLPLSVKKFKTTILNEYLI